MARYEPCPGAEAWLLRNDRARGTHYAPHRLRSASWRPHRLAHPPGAFPGEPVSGDRICRSTTVFLNVVEPRLRVNSSRVPGGASQKRLRGSTFGSVRHLVASRSPTLRSTSPLRI